MGLTFENRENCHSSPPPIFFVFEDGGRRINSFSLFEEKMQYNRVINNLAASLWENIFYGENSLFARSMFSGD